MPSVQRVLMDSTARIAEPFLDGLGASPTPPIDTASYTIRNSEGVVTSSGTANPTANPSEFWVPLTTVDTAILDRLTITWANPSVGEMSSTVEIVGGFLFSIADLRATSTVLANTTRYTSLALANLRTAVEDALEGELGYALVPRFGTQTFASGGSSLRLSPYLRSVRSASDDGAALVIGDLDLAYDAVGYVTGYQFYGPTTLGFEHGMDAPSPRAQMAGLQLAKSWAITGPIDDRTTNFTSPETGITSTYATPGFGGSIFGLPSVDQWVASARLFPVA